MSDAATGHARAGPRRRPGRHGRPRRRADVVRRPPGRERAGEVDDLADAHRARALRAARARRHRAPTSPAGCSGSTPRGTTRGRSWSGSPARSWSASAPTPARRSTSASTRGDRVVQVAQVDSTYLLGTRDWTEIDVPAHCSALGKVLPRLGRPRPPRGRAGAAHPATLPDRRRPAPRRPARPRARLGADRGRARDRAHRHRRTRVRHPRRRRRLARDLRTHPAAGGPARRARPPPARPVHRAVIAAARPRPPRPRSPRLPAPRRWSHDPRGDPSGPLRRDAGGQRPARARADQRGPRASTWSRRRCSSTP